MTPMILASSAAPRDAWQIADTDPSILRIQIDPESGNLWVLTPHGANEKPDGTLESWDLFSPDGEYLEQVAIPLGAEIRDGTCYLVGDRRLVVVRGTSASFRGEGEADEEDLEPEPLEVISYVIR